MSHLQGGDEFSGGRDLLVGMQSTVLDEAARLKDELVELHRDVKAQAGKGKGGGKGIRYTRTRPLQIALSSAVHHPTRMFANPRCG
jgi:hypothetical protein